MLNVDREISETTFPRTAGVVSDKAVLMCTHELALQLAVASYYFENAIFCTVSIMASSLRLEKSGSAVLLQELN